MAASGGGGLANYRSLVDRVDDRCREIESAFAEEIACRKGCAGCCRHITVFPVEAEALSRALAALDGGSLGSVKMQARRATADGPCPLLVEDACAVYDHRPIICRTHGLAVLTREGDEPRVDFCPDNFAGRAGLPSEAVIDLDRLNETLWAVNRVFEGERRGDRYFPERILIADIVLAMAATG